MIRSFVGNYRSHYYGTHIPRWVWVNFNLGKECTVDKGMTLLQVHAGGNARKPILRADETDFYYPTFSHLMHQDV